MEAELRVAEFIAYDVPNYDGRSAFILHVANFQDAKFLIRELQFRGFDARVERWKHELQVVVDLDEIPPVYVCSICDECKPGCDCEGLVFRIAANGDILQSDFADYFTELDFNQANGKDLTLFIKQCAVYLKNMKKNFQTKKKTKKGFVLTCFSDGTIQEGHLYFPCIQYQLANRDVVLAFLEATKRWMEEVIVIPLEKSIFFRMRDNKMEQGQYDEKQNRVLFHDVRKEDWQRFVLDFNFVSKDVNFVSNDVPNDKTNIQFRLFTIFDDVLLCQDSPNNLELHKATPAQTKAFAQALNEFSKTAASFESQTCRLTKC